MVVGSIQDSAVSLVSVFLWEKLLRKSIFLFVHHLVDVLTACLKLLLGFFETFRDRQDSVFSCFSTEELE